MKLNGFADQRQDFLSRFPGGDTTREIRNMGSIGGRAFLNNY